MESMTRMAVPETKREGTGMVESHSTDYAYGLWPLAAINIALFAGFLLSFAKPDTKIEWRSLGLFASFIVALFVEMYGFPLTIYFLVSFFGIRSDHGTLLHALSNVMIIAGAIIVAKGWNAIHQGHGKIVTSGPYAHVRHPQYAGFIIVILGFLIQWPTLVTLIMAPILITRYVLLAKKEEALVIKEFPQEYREYASRVPAW